MSLQHTAGVCFIHGTAGLAQYTDASTTEPAVIAFGDKVEIVDDPAVPVEAAIVTLRTTDGRTLTHEIRHALGSLGRPMGDREIVAKVRDLAAFGGSGCDIDRLIDAVWGLERIEDAATVVRLTGNRP